MPQSNVVFIRIVTNSLLTGEGVPVKYFFSHIPCHVECSLLPFWYILKGHLTSVRGPEKKTSEYHSSCHPSLLGMIYSQIVEMHSGSTFP